MKKTITPQHRKQIPKDDISLNIVEEEGALKLEVKLTNLAANLSDAAQDGAIILEAYNRIDIKRIDLGLVRDYVEDLSRHPLPFSLPLRAKINFRLKVINPNTYQILGYAENLKEEKYTKSLLELSHDPTVTNIVQIDFDNDEHPILLINPSLAPCMEQLKPLIAEVALKEILTHILVVNPSPNLEEHKWYKFATQFHDEDATDKEPEEKLQWIQEVLCNFADDKKLIDKLIGGIRHD